MGGGGGGFDDVCILVPADVLYMSQIRRQTEKNNRAYQKFEKRVSEVSRKNKKGGVIIPDDNIT